MSEIRLPVMFGDSPVGLAPCEGLATFPAFMPKAYYVVRCETKPAPGASAKIRGKEPCGYLRPGEKVTVQIEGTGYVSVALVLRPLTVDSPD